MDIEVVMPAIGAGTTQGKILQWLKQSGDTVKVGDILAEIETDKAVIELEAVDSGVLDRIHVEAGDTEVPVGDVIATLLRASAQATASGAGAGAAPASVAAASAVTAPAAAAPALSAGPAGGATAQDVPRQAAPFPAASAAAAPPPSHRLFASPSARRLARIMGVDLNTLSGSGPNGRIVRVDIEHAAGQAADGAAAHTAAHEPGLAAAIDAAIDADNRHAALATSRASAASSATPWPSRPASSALTPHTPMRATIARRLVQSKQQIPHFYLSVDCRMDAMMAARAALNRSAESGANSNANNSANSSTNNNAAPLAQPHRYSLNDLLLLAVARAAQRVPDVNAQWTDDGVLRHEQVDISVAVALDSGLITPILRNAAALGLAAISAQVRQLTAQARAGRLRPEQYEGGSLTVSNLGMHGVQSFAAIINPPQSVILAAGAVTRQPVVEGDALAIGHVMNLTLSADHRVVDGAVGARFLKEVRHFLEHPIELIL